VKRKNKKLSSTILGSGCLKRGRILEGSLKKRNVMQKKKGVDWAPKKGEQEGDFLNLGVL